MGLAALGIQAYMLASTTNKEVEKFVYKALDKGEGELKILYVTPEKISKSKRFMSKLEKCHHAGRLSLIAIDEAHCCSQWGHDFRPDYKNLGILKVQFPSVPMIALTATATNKVQIDLIEMLHIPRCVKFVSTINRPNLFYKVCLFSISNRGKSIHTTDFAKFKEYHKIWEVPINTTTFANTSYLYTELEKCHFALLPHLTFNFLSFA
jgi:superfamily II DNA helicase RecQ